MPYYGRRYGRMSVRQREGIAMLALRRYQAILRAKARAARARRMKIMREKRVAKKLFRKKSSFKFRPKWRAKKPTKRHNLGKFITTLSDGRKLYQYGATR